MKYVIIFLIIINHFAFYAQKNPEVSDVLILTRPTKAEIGMATTPEVADLGKYGDLNINTSIGLLNHVIPIFTIKLKNYELPISLSYNYSGLRVEDESGIVGLGWNLKSGGFINRDIRGRSPDEKGYYVHADMIKRYYFGNQKHYPNIQELSEGKIKDLLGMAAVNPMVGIWGDTQPDKFTFNMLGLEGHYTHNLNRRPILFPIKPYYIEDFITKNDDLHPDKIRVLNEKGILFNFNKTTYSRQVTYGETYEETGPFPTEWWISKIEEPYSNKTIKFEYYNGNDFNLPTPTIEYTKMTFIESLSKKIKSVSKPDDPYADIDTTYTRNPWGISNHLERTFVKAIYFPEGKITFEISMHNYSGDVNNNNIYNLDKIVIYKKNNQDIYKKMFTYEFIYNEPSSPNKLLLQIIKKDRYGNTIPFYQFEYNLDNNNSVPKNLNVRSQDYWGYYNGKENPSLLEKFRLINNNYNIDRNPDFKKTLIGSLRKIIYPTGGYSQINYELNKYYKSNLINTGGRTLEAGGLRVASYISCPDDTGNFCVQHYFKYRTPDGASSGKTYKPVEPMIKRSSIAYENNFTITTIDTETESISSNVALSSLLGSFTLYNRVEHFIKNDTITGKTIDYYDNDFLSNDYFQSNKFFRQKFSDQAWKYGKLLQKDIFKFNNSNGKFILTKRIRNTYQSFSPYEENPNTMHLAIGIFGRIDNLVLKMPYSRDDILVSPGIDIIRPELYNLVSKEEIEYFDQNALHKITRFNYDLYTGNLRKKSTYDSKGHLLTTNYLYPNDVTNINSLGNNPPINTAQFESYQQMQKPDEIHPNYQNRVGEPIQIISKKNGLDLSKKIRRITFKNLGPLYNENNQPVLNKNRLVYDQILEGERNHRLEPRVTYHHYDPYGNPTEVSKPDGTHIYYIYGYQHTKPVAKIVNFTQAQAQSLQAQIDAAVTASDKDEDAASEAALRTALDNLRQALPDNTQVTTYTYDPLIGVTSITDPKGDTQYYIYDSFNRLKYIKDKEGHILKEYKYHYKLIPKPIVSDGIDISNHIISNQTVTFSVSTTPSSGSGGGLTYEWSVLSGGTAVGNSTSNQFSVQYTCAPNVQIEVQCTIRDVNFPDNNLTLSKTFTWNKCLSNGTLQVYPTYLNGLVKDLDKIEFKVANLSGGNGNLTYRWYYTDLNSNTGDTLIGTTTTPNFTLTNPDSYCGKNFKAKCIVTDNVSGQQLILSNGVTYNFACFEINPDFHDIHPVEPH